MLFWTSFAFISWQQFQVKTFIILFINQISSTSECLSLSLSKSSFAHCLGQDPWPCCLFPSIFHTVKCVLSRVIVANFTMLFLLLVPALCLIHDIFACMLINLLFVRQFNPLISLFFILFLACVCFFPYPKTAFAVLDKLPDLNNSYCLELIHIRFLSWCDSSFWK